MTETPDDLLAAALSGASMGGPADTTAARRCKVGRILDTISDANRATLLDLLESKVSVDNLALMLANGGHTASATLIYRHRRGVCLCAYRTETTPVTDFHGRTAQHLAELCLAFDAA